jgi:probable O-glycosylation ligase (exosortase A-associated)
MMLILWMGVTTAAAILVDASVERYIAFLKVVFMTFVALAVVRSRGEIIGLVWVIAMSIGFFGVKGGLFTILSGGGHRVWGPPDSVVEGNNEIAVALVVIVPLLFFLSQHLEISRPRRLRGEGWTKVLKYGLIAMMMLCAVAALGSQSRGALLAIGAMFSVLWWRSRSKLTIGLALVLMVPVVLAFLPESWHARMETIGSYDEDASALGRINAWTMAFNIAKDRITGAGFATAAEVIYAQYAPDPNYVLVAHSIYFQILGEHGFIGLALYLLMWALTYIAAGRIRALAAGRGAESEWVVSLASMLQVSMVGFAVGGAFLSLAYWDLPYYMLVLVYVLRAYATQELATHRQQALPDRVVLQR